MTILARFSPVSRVGLAAIAALAPVVFAAPTEVSSRAALDDDVDEHPLDLRASLSGGDAAELIALSEEAESAGDLDRALWFAKLAVDHAGDGKLAKTAKTRWIDAREAAGMEGEDPVEMMRDFAKELFGIAKGCESRKLYANAADLFNQCKGTAYDAEARAKLEKFAGNKKAIEGMLESGVAVDVQRRERLTKETIARLDEEHSEWENALVVEGDNYELTTNMGYVMAHQMLDAMEQINKFYRKVFGLERKRLRKCRVYVYKNREDFDRIAQPGSSGVQGYYSPSESTVHTYDHAVMDWLGREYLWSTLFHEASHQFTREIWKLLIPTWLNEGTGSYFEGARLLPGGFIAVNKIPPRRLRALIRDIGPASKSGETSTGAGSNGLNLKTVVSYMQPGSYPGPYYPWGWGLVYFCRNFENDKSERPYLEAYEDFMKSYQEGSGTRNPFKRFEEFFVEEERHPGIDSFDAFESLWKSYIRQLALIEFGGEDQADVLVARGEKQLADGFPENAMESFQWATEKNARHATAWMRLGEAALATKEKKYRDVALYSYRRLAALSQRQVDPEGALPHFDGKAEEGYAAALAGIKKVDGSIVRALDEKLGGIVDASQTAATAFIDAGYPRMGLALLRDADALLDGHGALRSSLNALMEETEEDGRLARQLPVDESLSAWVTEDEGWKAGADGSIECGKGRGVRTLRLAESPPKIFRFEADVETGGDLVGLLFDGQPLDESYFVVNPGSLCALMKYDPDMERMMERGSPFETIESFADGAPGRRVKEFHMAIDVEHSQMRVFIDGELVGTHKAASEELAGQVGLAVQGDGATFRNVRLSY